MGRPDQNLFADLPDALPEELIDVLAEGERSVRIERIVSRGHSSPDGFWYDQDSVEWVVLLRGSARLEFADQQAAVELAPGDWLEIAAHRRHRVAATSADEATVWLAVFFGGASGTPAAEN